jgi:Uma2 family endonuclease
MLINPKIIIEVLSPTTESYDRGEKFRRYRTHLATLADYVLVSQNMPLIEHFRRQSDDEWLLSTVSELDDTLRLASIDCALRLSEIYDRVVFPEETIEPRDQDELL